MLYGEMLMHLFPTKIKTIFVSNKLIKINLKVESYFTVCLVQCRSCTLIVKEEYDVESALFLFCHIQ